jgi:hypothetical protein
MIRIVEDVGAPATVIAVDMITLELAPQANEWVAYGLTALGYLGAMFRFGGEYVKNIGVASLPLTARHLRDRIKTPMTQRVSGGAARLALQHRSAGAPVSRSYQPEFENVAPYAI